MKKIVIASLIALAGIKSSNAADTLHTRLLQSYYNIKNALASDDGTKAAVEANSYIRLLNGIDYKIISEGNIKILLKDAGGIADTADINAQRKFFQNLSANMVLVSRSVKPGTGPVFVIYCPMKKAVWLNNSVEIANPYYGSSMLTCGEVQEEIKTTGKLN